MTRTTCQISVSLDGYVAGPDQTFEDPLGRGGEQLHEWMFADRPHPADAEVRAHAFDGIGAYVMGRNMFGGGPGPWDEAWRGWWGEDPPFHRAVFVLTQHAREPLPMDGGTTFHFVTEGLDAALTQAREAAGDGDVHVAGGAATVDQALAAGRLDELFLHVVPVLLGGGRRLFEGAGDPRLEPVEVVASPAVTHLRYRVGAQ